MFSNTITLFNKQGDYWYPTVVGGVYLRDDVATSFGSHGDVESDSAQLHIHYTKEGGAKVVSGKTYLLPKAWAACSDPSMHYTFTTGGDHCDFFMVGEWGGASVVSDSSSEYGLNGFYDWMNRNYDRVYAIQAAVCFNMLPHFEITAR